MRSGSKASPYKPTILLPKTTFPIAYSHKKVEPEILDQWLNGNVYQVVLAKNSRGPHYLLHDGPPYPNGDIHLGHALNKILKDIIVKYKLMSGHFAPYIPGWDCHGLPIETQLIKELGTSRKEIDVVAFRNLCRDYALRYVETQKKEFERLGVWGGWDHPYLTLDPKYEARIVELLGKLAEKGYVYRGRKPIHWCIHCETALAEAEIEYEEEESPSIYVKFAVVGKPLSIAIWTTTPWTLPANVAVAVHPDAKYVTVKYGDDHLLVAEALLPKLKTSFLENAAPVGEPISGCELEGWKLQHPFMNREVPVILAPFVTMEEGTGCVHIAPGHGADDYQIGLQYKLPTVMPVDNVGTFTAEAGDFAGMHIWKANPAIIDRLEKDRYLLAKEKLQHSYPHCWRCGNPVIFRATEQWFVSVDHNRLRESSYSAIDSIQWIPQWGERRIRAMMEGRPDWCISRQRSWGVPIPAFYCDGCGEVYLTGAFNEAARKLIAEHGTNAWFEKSVEEILPSGTACAKCGGTRFKKETDILDVWFESGGSHYAVQGSFSELTFPASLYLEGSDQHRGWFQTSMITGLALNGHAPYRAVLTHGFTVDEQGRKMSKSLGNVVDPQHVVDKYGADVLRLWVASADFRNDMSASEGILKQVQEAYSKIRNTCRFLLANLSDFDPRRDALSQRELSEVDRFLLQRLQHVIKRIRRAYDEFEFHIVFHTANEFCTNDLSAFYLDIVKDRLYCDGVKSSSRRSAQMVLWHSLLNLAALLAPVLSFTMEELRSHAPAQLGFPGSVSLLEMPVPDRAAVDRQLEEKWESILRIREEVYRELEKARAEKVIGSSLEADVILHAEAEVLEFLKEVERELPSVFIVSQVKVREKKKLTSTMVLAEKIRFLWIEIAKAAGDKCERCWIYSEAVGKSKKHPTLCQRCEGVVEAV